MDSAAFDFYTDRLRTALESAQGVIGLVTLGTTADAAFRDEWSDHDFWVITEAGAQYHLLKDLSWLPDVSNIEITVCHRELHRTVVYRNRHKVEFAVFDARQALDGKAQSHRILLDRGEVAELMQSIHQVTLNQAKAGHARPDSLENLCVLVWSACERDSRGELLSARQYLDGFVILRGDPSTRIEDIENVEIVFKDGIGYDLAKLIESVRGMVGSR
jgi:hypothetical protein